MSELLKSYFERDLSLAELDELGALLAASPEAAMTLQENARAFYLCLGLPEPEPRRKLGGWFMGGTAGLLLLGGLSFWQGSGQNSAARPSLGDDAAAFSVEGSSPRIAPIEASRGIQPSPKETGDYLSVVLKRKMAGHASVRILNGEGAEMRRLFDGRLESGDWNFRWDGKLATGNPAPAGTYFIEVNEDGRIKTKRVRMGKLN